MIKKNLTSSIILVMMLLITPCVSAQTYRQIKGWSKEVNDRLEDFLNSTITMKIGKWRFSMVTVRLWDRYLIIWRMKLYINMPTNILKEKRISFRKRKWRS